MTKSAAVEPAQDSKDVRLVSPWGDVLLRLENNLVDPRYTPDNLKSLYRIGFFFDTRTSRPTDIMPDADPGVIGIRYEMTSPTWITRQLDPNFPNHFNIYKDTGETKFGLEYRPSGQMNYDGKYILFDTKRPFPVLIECQDRPGDLPTRCQLWQRRQSAFTLSLSFNGERLAEWESLLAQAEAFAIKRVVKIETREDVTNAI